MRYVLLLLILSATAHANNFSEPGNLCYSALPATTTGELLVNRHIITSSPITTCSTDPYQMSTWTKVQDFFTNHFQMYGECDNCTPAIYTFEATFHDTTLPNNTHVWRAYVAPPANGGIIFYTPESTTFKSPTTAWLEYDGRSGDNYNDTDDVVGMWLYHFKDASCLFNPTSTCLFLSLTPVDEVDDATSHWYYLESGSDQPSDGNGHPGAYCSNKWVVFPECLQEEHTLPQGSPPEANCVWPDDLEKIQGCSTDTMDWRWESYDTQEPSGS
jgi:hypothetical protein